MTVPQHRRNTAPPPAIRQQRFWQLLGRFSSPRQLRDPDRLAAAVHGKVVVVTGASYGLGEAIAKQCGAAGATVVICARSADKLAQVAEQIRADGGTVHTYVTDIADEDSVRRFARDVLSDHGHIDVLVHNAGKSMNRAIHLSYRRPRDLNAIVGVNYLGPSRLTLAVLPYMRQRGQGHIINISTAGTLMYPFPRWGFYLSSKKGFEWWLRSVAMEIRKDGVLCTQYYLGHVYTRMSAPDRMLRSVPGLTAHDAAGGPSSAGRGPPRIGRSTCCTCSTRRYGSRWRPCPRRTRGSGRPGRVGSEPSRRSRWCWRTTTCCATARYPDGPASSRSL